MQRRYDGVHEVYQPACNINNLTTSYVPKIQRIFCKTFRVSERIHGITESREEREIYRVRRATSYKQRGKIYKWNKEVPHAETQSLKRPISRAFSSSDNLMIVLLSTLTVSGYLWYE